nr:MAG: hypothetical protein [Microviridae sp.]
MQKTKCKKTKMNWKIKTTKTRLIRKKVEVGEDMITKMQRILTSGEPITDTAPAIYQDADEGVNPLTNIRTDKFELATELSDKQAKEILKNRQEAIKTLKDKKNATKASPEQSKEA